MVDTAVLRGLDSGKRANYPRPIYSRLVAALKFSLYDFFVKRYLVTRFFYKNTLYKKRQAEIWVIFLLSQKLFELDPNKVCQSEALALKRTLNMF